MLGKKLLAVVTLINNYRASKGLPICTVNDALCKAAKWQARWQNTNYITDYPVDEDGTLLTAAIIAQRFGYEMPDHHWQATSVSCGKFSNAELAVTMWIGSPGHEANITIPFMTDIGVASVGGIWCAFFAGRQD